MSEKFCIFCGKEPKNKNLEHVIPQWLIKMTGREKEDVFSLYPDAEKHIPFMRFTFPACTECNSKYSKMEALVKPVLERVMSGQSVTGSDISLLMDWFDKVRVGLWLTNMYFDPKLKQDVQPNFYIDSRVGKVDRMLSVQQLDLSGGKGIYMGGTSTPLFQYSPTAFTMLINDFYFFSASRHSMVMPRTGFPSLVNVKVVNPETGLFESSIAKGRNKITNPVIQSFVPNKDSVTFYQPIYGGIQNYIVDDYVLEHTYDKTKGQGGIFVQKGNAGNTKYLQPDDKIGIRLHACKKYDLEQDAVRFQNQIHERSLTNSIDTRIGFAINNMLLKQMELQK